MSKKTLKFVSIGIGEIWNKAHHDAINACGKLVAVCDVDQNKMKDLAVKHYTNWKKMLKSEDCDVVTISTPNFEHVKMAIMAAKLGKRVILEKPIGLTEKERNLLDEYADKIAVCYQRRFNSQCKLIKSISDKIISIDAKILVRRDPYYWNTWRKDKRKSGGGNLINIDIHYLDLLQWWLGPFYGINFCKISERNGIDQIIDAKFNFSGIPVNFFGSSIHHNRNIDMRVKLNNGDELIYNLDDGTHTDLYKAFLFENKFINVLEANTSSQMVDNLYKYNKEND